MKFERINRIASIVIFCVVLVFLAFLRYTNPLSGDDVAGLTINRANSNYLDDYEAYGECEVKLYTNPIELFNKLQDSYTKWTGRVTCYFGKWIIGLIFSLPDSVIWPMFTVYIALTLFLMYWLVLRTILGNSRVIMKSPLICCIVSVLLFYMPKFSYGYMTRLIMYTMTNIYVLSCIFYLLLYGLIRKVLMEEQKLTLWKIIGINFIGLLAGLSHELFGAVWGMVFLVQLFRYLYEKKSIRWKCFILYIGYVVGYLICFFAPGNFNRVNQKHESGLRTLSIAQRMIESFRVHAYVEFNHILVAVVLFIPCMIVVVKVCRKESFAIVIRVLLGNIEWFLAFGLSVVGWGLVAQPVSYGMLLPNILLTVGSYRCLIELKQQSAERALKESAFITLSRYEWLIASIIMLVLTVRMVPVLNNAASASNEWNKQIMYAREQNIGEVNVHAYPQSLDSRFYDVRHINLQNAYDEDYYRVVYGTHIRVLDGDGK